ncbi:transcription factor UPBEAT1-like isoform X1 [Neltuma alba]|uniref:transcription factor UPBEAT1-like isoform X1 n=1 Tax=Neltuma alba TaxID=207710 RepID=UPI0010A4FCF9|nr:transcription factor UPBEAT1-like isoform X1 [Prosopis alba]
MGVSSQPSLAPFSFKDLVKKGAQVETQNSSCGHLRRKVTESQKAVSRKSVKSRRRGRILMKRRARLMEGSRRGANKMERRMTKLKRLIPDGERMGLDGLFRKTADYILALQMRVRVMQIMVKVVTASDQ